MGYRQARAAVDLFNQGEEGFEELSKRADLLDVLLEMGRAQVGPDLTQEEMLRGMAERHGRDEEDEDDGFRR